MHRSNLINSFRMQNRIFHVLFVCLLVLAFPLVHIMADEPDTLSGPAFPPDPGVVYTPPVVIIMGDTITSDPQDTTQTVPVEIDVFGDSTVVYNTEENTITLTSVDLGADGDTMTTVINYSGTDTLYIVLTDSSSIVADTIISSQSNIVISGEGHLEAVGDVPIIGVPTANITFDSVNMYVRSLPGPAAVRRRVRGIIKLDETGGPALSGFGSVDFNKVDVSPSDAMYGPVAGGGDDEDIINALMNAKGDVLTEFELTAKADPPVDDAVQNTKELRELDFNQPMYNILGVPVDATYKGIVIQNGRKYIIR